MTVVLPSNIHHIKHFTTSAKKIGVVVDESNLPLGTGFFAKIGSILFFITAKHVLVPDMFNKNLRLSFNFWDSGGEESCLLNVIDCYVDLESDLAFLHLNSGIDVTPEELDKSLFAHSDNYIVWGCPTQLAISEGSGKRFRILSLWCEKEIRDKNLRLKLDYTIQADQDLQSLGGISGGPIFNTSGEVIGINRRQIFSAKDTISSLDGTLLENIELLAYKHKNPRSFSAYELNYIVSIQFILEGSQAPLVFQALLAVDDSENFESVDVWLSHGVIGLLEGRHFTPKVRCIQTSYSMLWSQDSEYSIQLNEFNQKNLNPTELGDQRIKEMGKEVLHSMLNGGTTSQGNITFEEPIVSRIEFSNFENILNSFSLFPQRHFRK